MSEIFELAITAVGEVRDAEGNLISSEPIEATLTVTAEELAELVPQGVEPTEGEPS